MIFFYTFASVVLLVGAVLAVLYARFYWCKSSQLSSLSDDFTGETLQCVQADAYFERGRFFHDKSLFEKALSSYDAALILNPSHSLTQLYKKYALSQKILPSLIRNEASVLETSPVEVAEHFSSIVQEKQTFPQAGERESGSEGEIGRADIDDMPLVQPQPSPIDPVSPDVSLSIDPIHPPEDVGGEADNVKETEPSPEIMLVLDDDESEPSVLMLEDDNTAEEYCVLGKNFLQQGLFCEASEEYGKAIALNPQFIQAYLGRAAALIKTGSIDDAIADFDTIIELEPKHIGARNKRGDLFLHQNYIAEAVDTYTVSLSIDPEQPKCFLRRGIAYFRDGKFSDAISDFTRAISLDPECKAAYQDRGMAFKRQGMLEEAENDFKKAGVGQGRNDTTVKLLSDELQEVFDQALQHLENENDAQALLSFNRILKEAPEHADSYLQRGNINLKNKGYERAIADYSKAIECNSLCGMAYLKRGQAHILANLYFDAIADFDRSAELMPENKDVYLHRGRANSQRAQREDAIADFTKTIEIDPENSAAYFDRGTEFQNLGEYDKALPDYEKACSLGNNAACIASMNLKEE